MSSNEIHVQDASQKSEEGEQLSAVRQEMAQNGKQKTKNEPALIVALARGETVTDACRQSGVAERTAHRRLEDTEFVRQVRTCRSQMLDCAVGNLSFAASEAVGTLRSLLTAESETVRLGAARAILDHVTKLRETQELEERIVALEEKLPTYSGGRT